MELGRTPGTRAFWSILESQPWRSDSHLHGIFQMKHHGHKSGVDTGAFTINFRISKRIPKTLRNPKLYATMVTQITRSHPATPLRS